MALQFYQNIDEAENEEPQPQLSPSLTFGAATSNIDKQSLVGPSKSKFFTKGGRASPISSDLEESDLSIETPITRG